MTENSNFSQVVCAVCNRPGELNDIVGTCSVCRSKALALDAIAPSFAADKVDRMFRKGLLPDIAWLVVTVLLTSFMCYKEFYRLAVFFAILIGLVWGWMFAHVHIISMLRSTHTLDPFSDTENVNPKCNVHYTIGTEDGSKTLRL